MRRLGWPFLAHFAVVLWLFGPSLFGGRALYFRDVSVYYYPNYVFVEHSLRQHVWPLWNPTSDAGAPFLIADPLELTLLWTGADNALRFGPPLYLLLGMTGVSALALVLELGTCGAWASGLFYGLSGYVLSTVNLFPLLHGCAWAGWVIAAAVRLWRKPSLRNAVGTALLAALQVSTLGVEIALASGVFAIGLLDVRPSLRRLQAAATALVLALLLSAPCWLGVRAMMVGTSRAEGFSAEELFSWSVRPAVLLDAVFPSFFGDVHTFSNVGYWGQSFYPDGYPYLLSLYVGPTVLLLSFLSGRFVGWWRLWALAGVGIAAALGRYGPLASAEAVLLGHFRFPVKFLFLSTLAICLLAGKGIDRALRRVPSGWLTTPGVLLVGAALLIARWPDLPGLVAGRLLPALNSPLARFVVVTTWPRSFGVAGALLVAAALALRVRRLAPVAVALASLDLLIVNGNINMFASKAFYELTPAIRSMLDGVRRNDGRLFSYGLPEDKRVHWFPAVTAKNSDVWLYYMDRQLLVPRTPLLDGLDSAFDEDRTGWAPAGSTLFPAERASSGFRRIRERLRSASVRWILSIEPLPRDEASERAQAAVPGIAEPLHLYELPDALPRAFWTSTLADTSQVGAEGRVTYERIDPHTLRLRVSSPAGFVVVTEGYNAAWRAESSGRPRPVLHAGSRYWAVPTNGGTEEITVRFEPSWRTPALLSLAVGTVGALILLAVSSERRRRQGSSETAARNDFV